MNRILALTILAASVLTAQTLPAATITASSCEASDVQAAIDQAVDDDVVQVPAGQCTWTTQVAIGSITSWNPITYEGKRIEFRGAGIDQTVIHIDITSGDEALSVSGEAGKPVRITELTFTGAKNVGRCQKAIVMGGDADGWRIDHVQINYLDVTGASPGCGIAAFGVGVVDHCQFENVYTAVTPFGDGDASWERPLALGSCDAVYIEDNVMNNTEIVGDGATDGYGGARYVFRNNHILNARAGHHGLDSGGYRSPHSFEIYNNVFEWTVDNSWYTWRSRGGTGVIFGNTITGALNESTSFGLVNYRTCCCHLCTNIGPDAYGASCDPFVACDSPLHTNCGSWGRCDGTAPIDGNSPGMMGYPCLDQAGRSTDMEHDGVQDLEPVYEWDNLINGSNADLSVNDPWGCAEPAMTDHIQEGRDFHNDIQRPGYTPCSYPHPLTGGAGATGGTGGTGEAGGTTGGTGGTGGAGGTGGTGGAGGTTGGAGGTTGGVAGAGAQAASTNNDGCGCRLVGRSSAWAARDLGLVLLLGLGWRRRSNGR